MTTLAYFEGEIVPFEQANVSIACNTLHYGTGCFGGLRAFWNDEQEQLYFFRPRDHFQRLLNSAKLLYCNLDYTVDQLVDISVELLSREGWRQNVYIRPIVYKDDGIFRVWLHDSNDKLAIFTQRVGITSNRTERFGSTSAHGAGWTTQPCLPVVKSTAPMSTAHWPRAMQCSAALMTQSCSIKMVMWQKVVQQIS